jgi:hypothetical protein
LGVRDELMKVRFVALLYGREGARHGLGFGSGGLRLCHLSLRQSVEDANPSPFKDWQGYFLTQSNPMHITCAI